MTFVLLHGAGGSGASWDLVAAALRERGHEALAVDLPCDDDRAGWADYADAAAAAIGDRRDVCVVAQSLAGFVAPLVCDRADVGLLVLVAAMIPAPGERGVDWWAASGQEAAVAGRDDLDDPVALYVHDVAPELAARELERSRDQSMTPMLEPWPRAGWPDVPTRFVLCRDDRLFPAAWMRRHVRERLGIEPDEIDGGHCPYLARPVELAERLIAMRTGDNPTATGVAVRETA